MAARVQIPASPLQTPEESTLRGFCYAVVALQRIVVNCEKWISTAHTTAHNTKNFTAYTGETVCYMVTTFRFTYTHNAVFRLRRGGNPRQGSRVRG